uniref:Uncharacterized protein n=1 Tax=Tetranychus urticae TaxID=32264 RepID=T1L3W6_TETUR
MRLKPKNLIWRSLSKLVEILSVRTRVEFCGHSFINISKNKIHCCLTEYQNPYEQYRLDFFHVVNEKRQSPPEYAELDDLKLLNDGDCFALAMLVDGVPPFRVNLWLHHRSNFDDNQCTPAYCQHINGRDFLNRRIEIIKHVESKYRQLYTGNQMSTIRSMGIDPYLRPICKLSIAAGAVFESYPYFPRTHG